ncbi:hypothetical protein FHR24_002861 [Wenyingzhuangia heitensis]|uniref:DUF721 domain-containing protein n=1 Tax=Wenyingzhuangia heitensis TaxID=1487859 RepID=A0ABX0UDF8_9FLAO|nr:hypothetical protein [Wenyingzhuangia heitensis]NIJ46374.1 hypothetical protein [Wenyingzhuangia heitensis]
MRTLENIYQNTLGTSYKLYHQQNKPSIALEINQISFLINNQELKAFVNSTESIINYHSQCTCPPDLENKMVIYQAKQTEIRMILSYNQLIQLKDLLKGTHFKLSMDSILHKYKIN